MSGVLPGELERIGRVRLAGSEAIRPQTPLEQIQVRRTVDLGGGSAERFGGGQFGGQTPDTVERVIGLGSKLKAREQQANVVKPRAFGRDGTVVRSSMIQCAWA